MRSFKRERSRAPCAARALFQIRLPDLIPGKVNHPASTTFVGLPREDPSNRSRFCCGRVPCMHGYTYSYDTGARSPMAIPAIADARRAARIGVRLAYNIEMNGEYARNYQHVGGVPGGEHHHPEFGIFGHVCPSFGPLWGWSSWSLYGLEPSGNSWCLWHQVRTHGPAAAWDQPRVNYACAPICSASPCCLPSTGFRVYDNINHSYASGTLARLVLDATLVDEWRPASPPSPPALPPAA